MSHGKFAVGYFFLDQATDEDAGNGVRKSAKARGGLEPLHQIHDPDLQRIGQNLHRLKRGIALPALDFTDVRAV